MSIASVLKVVSLAASLSCASSYAQTYKFSDLNILGGSYSSATSINNLGQVLGVASAAPLSTAVTTLWDSATSAHALGAPSSFWAVDINDLGQVAGNVGFLAPGGSPANASRAALFDANGLTLFAGLQASPAGSAASGINNLGQVVGYAQATTTYQYNPSYFTTHAAIFSVGNAAIDLGTVGGTNSFGAAINNTGAVVGRSTLSGDFNVLPAVWQGGTKTSLAGWNVFDINDKGQVAGSSFRDLTPPGWEPVLIQTATLFEANGDVVYLDTTVNLNGVSIARALNESGLVVGYARQGDTQVTHGMLWSTEGLSIDLNTYLDASLLAAGWYISDANDINEAGSIVGNLVNQWSGENHAYLLTVPAVPEPSTYGLLLAGGAFGAWRIRKQRAVTGSGRLAAR